MHGRNQIHYFLKIFTDDLCTDQVPSVDQDLLISTKQGLKLVSQTAVAKGGASLWDRLFLIHSSALLLSDAAYHVIRKLRVCPSIQWHPVKITWRNSIHPYWVGNTLEQHDIWNDPTSVSSWIDREGFPNQKKIASLRKGVALPEAIPALDLFRAGSGDWVGSDSFKMAWETNQFAGMHFEPID